ncbi:MAG: hypothetical protein V5B32_11810 [Candidatus Accumulibacter sp. UW26]|uniref:hypothetical protein n=1 Tax=Candidatus Accumulibacter necessarius TaxID=2954386 RepID=UPI002FC3AA25
MSGKRPAGFPQRQSGLALLALLAVFTLGGLYFFLAQLNAMPLPAARQQNAAALLAEARQALIGDAIARLPVGDAGYLRYPDLGSTEGQSSGTFPGDGIGRSVIGKFPWKTLDTLIARTMQGECLWYVVSGYLKHAAWKTTSFNWDSQGQIDIIDGSGRVIAANLAALLVAPGAALEGQQRALAAATYTECGGNYDARNYLDPFDSANAVGGQVNYFAGSTNSRVAPGTGNKTFVVAANDHYNDRFTFITVNEIFDPLLRRSDFAGAIGSLLDDPTFQEHLQAIAVAGSKGTDHLDCHCNQVKVTIDENNIETRTCEEVTQKNVDDEKDGAKKSALAQAYAFQLFCRNWQEMLFLSELSAPAQITVEGLAAFGFACKRVLIFAGRKANGQARSAAEKADRNSYLEGDNRSAFGDPAARAFSGSPGAFDTAHPATDLVRCLREAIL